MLHRQYRHSPESRSMSFFFGLLYPWKAQNSRFFAALKRRRLRLFESCVTFYCEDILGISAFLLFAFCEYGGGIGILSGPEEDFNPGAVEGKNISIYLF